LLNAGEVALSSFTFARTDDEIAAVSKPTGSEAPKISDASENARHYARAQSNWERPDYVVHSGLTDEWLRRYADTIVDVTGLNGTQRVLEIGCGDGQVSELLLPHVASLSAFDFSSRLVAAAQQRLPGCDVWQQSFLDPMPSGFDVVFSFGVLQYAHPDDFVPLLRNCLASVRPGGLVAHMAIPDRRKRHHIYFLGLDDKRGVAGLKARARASLRAAKAIVKPPPSIWDGSHMHDFRAAAAALSSEADVRVIDAANYTYGSSILLTRPTES
jgi:cyclopropane fatty-acyl-phospholipid synthase-like methyltransferase